MTKRAIRKIRKVCWREFLLFPPSQEGKYGRRRIDVVWKDEKRSSRKCG
jgi:hypothetical protein